MCEARSEVKGQEELEVLNEQERKVIEEKKEEGKKDSATSSDECCVPLCNPITCGP